MLQQNMRQGYKCPDFGVFWPAGGDAAIWTLKFVTNNTKNISKK
jgi:hypothetical protein